MILLVLVIVIIPAIALAAEVLQEIAKQVANNFLQHYVATYGNWAGSGAPVLQDIELVSHEGAPITYNFRVNPRGHLLVPYFDDFSPVVLYSDTSGFVPSRVSEPGSIESWILPEMSATYKNIQAKRAALAADKSLKYAETEVARAWKLYKENDPSARATAISGYRNATAGPLLTTAWDQGDDNISPYTYNLYTPAGTGASGTCTHTLTGCVATAWSQMMKYWNWPDVGVGSHSYTWNGQTLSANFAHTYDWANMPSQLTTSSTTAQIQAVAQLIYDMGVATDMNYGCNSVGGSSSNMYADNPAILPAFFKYKTGMQQIGRGSYTAGQWFSFFQTEFDAVPPRPVIFSIFSTSGGHEIVSDGYQTGTTNYVHVNMGWSGSYNGYYDVTNNWTTGSYTWQANNQVIVTGIQPNNTTTTCTYSISPTSQTFTSAANTGSVAVTASASSCAWSATSSVSWAAITSASGLGSSTVTFSVAANTGAARTGYLTVAGQTFTVTQSGAGGGGGSSEIRVQAVTLSENMLFNQNKTITLTGGYDATFSAVGGTMTTVQGSLTISGGAVTVSNIVIQ